MSDQWNDYAEGLEANSAILETMLSENKMMTSVANAMQETLGENTDAMNRLDVTISNMTGKVESAAQEVFTRVENEAATTLEKVNRAANLAQKNSEEATAQALNDIEKARKGLVATAIAVSGIAVLVCVVLFFLVTGALTLQFKTGQGFISDYAFAIVLVGALLFFLLGLVARGKR